MRKLFPIFIFLCSIKSFSQSASGNLSFSTADAGFTNAVWNLDYSIDLAPGEGNETVWLHTDNPSLSFANASYSYKGKTYSPGDLGLTSWPTDIREPYLYVDIVIKYKGQVVRSLPSYQVVSHPLKLGSFISEASIENMNLVIGGINIPFSGFSISDFTASVGGDAYNKTITKRNSDVERMIAARNQNKSTGSGSSGSVSIGNGNRTTNGKTSSSSSGITPSSTLSRSATTTTANMFVSPTQQDTKSENLLILNIF